MIQIMNNNNQWGETFMQLVASNALKKSFWMEEAEAEMPSNNLTQYAGNHETDVVIIGGGFVGLWSALNIKKLSPNTRVVVLEKDHCGAGASGRNGGMAMSWWPKIGTLTSFCSKEEALFLAKSSEQAIYDLGVFCQKHNIDAEFIQNGWLWTATCQAHLDSWQSTIATCQKLGVTPFEVIPAEKLQQISGSNIHLAGVLEKSNATVQPAKLAKGMARVAVEQGIEIYEQSMVSQIDANNGKNSLTITDPAQQIIGSLTCNKVILATNAWASTIPELLKQFTPVNSSVIASEESLDELEKLGWKDGESITDSQLMVDYYRTTQKGRVVFGKGTGAISYKGIINDVFSHHDQSIDLTIKDFHRCYPSLKNKKITHQWSGPIDRTYDSLPIFGTLKDNPNIIYGIGWSGNGVSPSQLGGKILASLALELDNEWSRCPLVNRQTKSFPSEPFRYVGGNLVRNAVLRKEQREIANLQPRKIDLMFAKLAPAGLEDKS